jgi:hypothetical protein
MSEEYDFFKMMHGKTIEDVGREVPSADNTVRQAMKQLTSRYPLRLLGRSQQGDVYISEEERMANYYLLGAPGEGKSKMMEFNIRADIRMGNGLCLLDPSEKGDTCHNILAYCAKINHQKVVLIDPDTLVQHKKIACLKPLRNYKDDKGRVIRIDDRSVEGVMEAVNTLFGVKDINTPRIRRYLRALLRRLAEHNLTLYETQEFSEWFDIKKHPIIGNDRDSRTLKSVFRSPFTFENYFLSSVGRLDVFWDEPLSLMLGADEGIDFVRMVADGWVILVNMSPYRLSETQAELLGIMVVSQLVQAVDKLINTKNWQGVYYLYMDEAARFATKQIDTLLSFKRKSGLRLILAHHYFKQFKDEQVLNSITNNARIKLMFNTPDYDDRMRMVKALGYGGDIPPVVAAFANQNLPKQYAVLKKNKEDPVRIMIPDVKPVPITQKEVDAYTAQLLEQPWYKTKEQIQDQIDARFTKTKNTVRSGAAKVSDDKADNQPDSSPRPESVGDDTKERPKAPKRKPISF